MLRLIAYGFGVFIFAMAAITGLAACFTPTGFDSSKLPPVVVSAVLAFVCAAAMYGRIRSRRMAKNQRALAANVLTQMADGAMPVMTSTKVRPKTGETVYFAAPAELLKIQTSSRKTAGAGISLRVAKGITLHSGASKSQSQKSLELVANGELAMLNERIVFAGDFKSFEYNFAALTHIEPMDDGFIIHQGNTSQIVRLKASAPDIQVAHAVINKLLDRAAATA